MRILRRLVALFIICSINLNIFTVSNVFAVNEITVSAKGAVLLEASTNTVLYSKNADARLPMASTTKVMTALIAIENGNLDEIVVTDDAAYGIEGSSIYLEKNEKISLRDLLYGLMLRSGNDAAVAIACHIGGSIEGFAKLMNEKASELGLKNTNFITPNGLHDEQHYTSAYDLAIIEKKKKKNETFKEIVSTRYYEAKKKKKKRTMQNKNKILWEFDGGNGIKTGYTKAAGKCLVFSADRDGMQLIGVVLNCPDMFPDAEKILDYGFENYQMQKVLSKGDTVARILVEHGDKNMLAISPKNDIIVPVRKDEGLKLNTSVKIEPDLEAPINSDTVLGEVEFYDGDRIMLSCPLYSMESINKIEERNFGYYFKGLISNWN